MKTRIIASITVLAGIMACSTSKKSTRTPVVSTAPAAAPASTPVTRPANGIYEPGPEELTAIQSRFGDATSDQLKLGYVIYSMGACVQCHNAMNIHQRNETQWAGIIRDMAQRAGITDTQKDAVYRYVLAVKAVRANQQK